MFHCQQPKMHRFIDYFTYFTCVYYTTNPTERSAAANECSTSENDLESPVESYQALAERSTDLLGHCSASARWDSTDDSKSLSLVERSVAAAEGSVGLVV